MDKSKSVLSKLKNQSKSTGVGYQQLLLLLCQEEFLRRLSLSEYKDNFILKGGLFIYILSNFSSRGTVDMDFLLRNQSNSIENIESRIIEIIEVESGNDFISYEVKGVEKITIDKKYPGVSIKMIGKIADTKTPVNIDVGVGDVIIPKSQNRTMKSQIDEFDDVQVNTYSLESSLAEKFDAILQRLELTSRMKDYYDIWFIGKNFELNSAIFQQAVKETLDNRGTNITEKSIANIINLQHKQIILTRWKSYIKKMKLDIDLLDCINMIEALFSPILNNIISNKKDNQVWNPILEKWENKM